MKLAKLVCYTLDKIYEDNLEIFDKKFNAYQILIDSKPVKVTVLDEMSDKVVVKIGNKDVKHYEKIDFIRLLLEIDRPNCYLYNIDWDGSTLMKIIFSSENTVTVNKMVGYNIVATGKDVSKTVTHTEFFHWIEHKKVC